MDKRITIEDIAQEAQVSTATVSRYLNTPEKVAEKTRQKVQAAIDKLQYAPGKKVASKAVTVEEVADLANVSKATVSRVLNNSSLVGPKTRSEVLKAMEELNYQPNMIARQLRQQASKLIGIVLPDISNPFYSKVLKGIEEIAHSLEYDVVLMNTNYSEKREMKSLQTLVERRAEGFCFMCHHLDDDKIRRLEECGLPYVIVSRTVLNFPDVPYVNVDNYLGGYDATNHLIELGHQKIAMIAGPMEDECSSEDRIRGYQQALIDAGIGYRDDYLKIGNFTFARAAKLSKELMNASDPPTAIFAVSDETAIGAIRGAISVGYRVPEDLSVIGFDNLEMARFYNPALTTISQPRVKMGRKAVHMLLDIIENKKIKERQMILPHQLVVRESTAPFSD